MRMPQGANTAAEFSSLFGRIHCFYCVLSCALMLFMCVCVYAGSMSKGNGRSTKHTEDHGHGEPPRLPHPELRQERFLQEKTGEGITMQMELCS